MGLLIFFSVALPAGYLRLNLPMQERGSGVCAQPCSQPDKCYPAGCSAQCCAFQPQSYKYHPRVSPSVLPSCPGTCDDSCFPDCDDDCCSNMSELLKTSKTAAGSLLSAPPSITCPGSCHFLCYPQCSPQCCSSKPVENPCHSSCPAYCAPSCDTACCASRKSLVNGYDTLYNERFTDNPSRKVKTNAFPYFNYRTNFHSLISPPAMGPPTCKQKNAPSLINPSETPCEHVFF